LQAFTHRVEFVNLPMKMNFSCAAGPHRVMTTTMTDQFPPCPECSSAYVYQVDNLLTCPECGYEWVSKEPAETASDVRDSVGNPLLDGDTVTVIKDLKIKGSSSVVKVGTKVRGIRLESSRNW
jgi:protein PhnA